MINWKILWLKNHKTLTHSKKMIPWKSCWKIKWTHQLYLHFKMNLDIKFYLQTFLSKHLKKSDFLTSSNKKDGFSSWFFFHSRKFFRKFDWFFFWPSKMSSSASEILTSYQSRRKLFFFCTIFIRWKIFLQSRVFVYYTIVQTWWNINTTFLNNKSLICDTKEKQDKREFSRNISRHFPIINYGRNNILFVKLMKLYHNWSFFHLPLFFFCISESQKDCSSATQAWL